MGVKTHGNEQFLKLELIKAVTLIYTFCETDPKFHQKRSPAKREKPAKSAAARGDRQRRVTARAAAEGGQNDWGLFAGA